MKLKATLRLSHLNVRRENAGEGDGDLGTDLKLTGQLHLKDLRGLFHEDRGYAILEALYSAEGELASLAFANFDLTGKATAVDATFKTEIAGKEVKLRDVEVDSFSLKPLVGRQIDLTFRVKAHPSETQLAALAEMLKTDLKVDLFSKQGELRFGPDDEEEVEQEEAEEA